MNNVTTLTHILECDALQFILEQCNLHDGIRLMKTSKSLYTHRHNTVAALWIWNCGISFLAEREIYWHPRPPSSDNFVVTSKSGDVFKVKKNMIWKRADIELHCLIGNPSTHQGNANVNPDDLIYRTPEHF